MFNERYHSGDSYMHAFIKLNKGLFKMPLPWKVWLSLLVAANVIVPLYYFQQLEAQIVLGTMAANVALMTFLTSRFGFTRVLGLGHIFWIPLLVFLLARLGNSPADDAYGTWLRVLIVLNCGSLMIDVVDVIRYLAGDREETVPGL
jgi:hypothetical protein